MDDISKHGQKPDTNKTATAMWFIILLGTVSLFADMTYEGARGISGPYLGALGGSAAVVGLVAGCGELFGYGIRYPAGWLGDRTRRYWTIMLAGYAINLFAVPLLALTGSWQTAALLFVVERIGRGIRSPIRDAMLSHAASRTGFGWGFGLHEAMDQCGAVTGPLLVAGALYWRYGYHTAFALLLVPATIAIALLLVARVLFPRPHGFDVSPPALQTAGFDRLYWIFVLTMALIGAGTVDFALVGYHFGHHNVFSAPEISSLFALAMASDAAAALLFGRLFDRAGMTTLLAGVSLAAIASPLIFFGGTHAAFLGVLFWGTGMGLQESVIRAVVAQMTAPERRATAFGVLNAVFGIAWFAGSVALGILYDYSLDAVVAISFGLQALAVLSLAVFKSRIDERLKAYSAPAAPPGEGSGE